MKLLASVLILSCGLGAQDTSPWGPPQKRVTPDAYKYAPPKVRAALKAKHCELPSGQTMDHTRLNIVSGQFAAPGQTDWAALCILPDGALRVLLFWGKADPPPCPAEIAHGWALEQKVPAHTAGGLYLMRQSEKQILIYRKFFGDPNANPVTHEGVEVGDEQASLIYYCYKGQWLELQGND